MLVACGSSDSDLGPPQDLVITRITIADFSGYETPQRLVIRTQAAWQDAWETIWRRASEVPALPVVNFNDQMVIIAAAGPKPTSGYSITVDSAMANRRTATLRVRSISPGSNCTTLPVVTRPVEVVRVPTRDNVTFEEVSETRACGS